MKSFLGLIFVFMMMNLGLIAAGAGIGFLLHWASPSVDRGMSILIGVVTAGYSTHYFARLMWFLGFYQPQRDDDDDNDNDDLPQPGAYTRRSSRSWKKEKRRNR